MAKLANKSDHKCKRWLVNPIRIIQRHCIIQILQIAGEWFGARSWGICLLLSVYHYAGGWGGGGGGVVLTWGIWAQICTGKQCFGPNLLNPDHDILCWSGTGCCKIRIQSGPESGSRPKYFMTKKRSRQKNFMTKKRYRRRKNLWTKTVIKDPVIQTEQYLNYFLNMFIFVKL